MKKKLPRIIACLMACVIAFNVIAIPRAKASAAVVGTSALATSALASYMTATGVPLTVISGGAGAASAGAASLISGYAAATGGTYSVVTTAIASGVTIGTGGVILISAAAAAVLAGVVAWAYNKYGVIEGANPVPVKVAAGANFADGSSVVIPYVDGLSSSDYEKAIEAGATCFDSTKTYVFESGRKFLPMRLDPDGKYAIPVVEADGRSWFWSTIFTVDDACPEFYLFSCRNDPETSVRPISFIYGYDDRAACSSWYSLDEVFGSPGSFGTVGLSAEYDYAPLPELSPLEQIELAPNLAPGIAPEAVPDAIFEKIAGNEFEPSYRVVPPVGDENVNPDPDPDLDSNSGLDSSESIGWLKRIALACEALADKILGGIESIFAPDPALMQEISAAFTDKFGFVSTLHNLGMDLLSIDASSAPPVVYIHLEDAEGSIYYGETCKALDMSWYARYKEDGDRIMSGFLWIGFLWLLFKRASAIINGAEMATDYGTDIHDGFRIRGERNGKRF